MTGDERDATSCATASLTAGPSRRGCLRRGRSRARRRSPSSSSRSSSRSPSRAAPRPRRQALRREPSECRRPAEKFREVRARAPPAAWRRAPTLHFIGRLQSNKAAHVAGYADVVQSVDRTKLVAALAKGAHAADRTLEVLLQVSLDGDTRVAASFPPTSTPSRIPGAAQEVLHLRGVMAVAPLGAVPDAAFARLQEVADGIRGPAPPVPTGSRPV